MLLSIIVSQLSYSQKTVKMTATFGSKNNDITELMYFQDVAMENFTFESPQIKGKYYEITLKEYRNGKLVNTKQLFEGSGYFEIDSTATSFRFYTQMEDRKLKTFIKGDGYGSRKQFFDLDEGKYFLKDFQGANKFTNVPLNEEFPILAIITPTMHKDGSGGICEVAQSGVAPEKLGEKFNIPHYFIISMQFKTSPQQ